MCGIIGYFGEKNVVPLLIDGLRKLEYRGYDSAGICVLNNWELKTIKNIGRVSELAENIELEKISGNIGIAHTRWATHGEPNEINAHPHLDCKKEIAIVHNGIIENYTSLKKLLEKEGHKIISDTDSEIVAHLVEKFYVGNIEDALIKSLKCVEGTFGLALLNKNEKKLLVARKSSPIAIGIANDGIFVASDVAALLEHTKKVVYLSDNEIATITKEGYSIKNLDGVKIDKQIHEITWSLDQIEKKGFKHFMLKEIFEQPEAIENTLRGRIRDNKVKLTLNLNVNFIKRITIVACGTSWHSALIGKYIIEKICKIPVEIDYASEFRYRSPIIKDGDVVIAISQSGETADTIAAIKEAKSKKAKTVGIVNVVGSTITREVDCGMYLHAGPEIGVASTKAFSCQIIALILFALYLNQERGFKLNEEFLQELISIPKKIKQILEKADYIKKIAEKFVNSMNFLFLGRGINFPVALEGALKLKEISYIHAEGYPAAEMKHGPIALIDENMPVVFLATKNHLSEKIFSNIQEVKARKGKVIAIVNDGEEVKKISDYIVSVPQTVDELSPIINIIPLQLLAYYIADLKNLDVDKPRNLAKSVTVE